MVNTSYADALNEALKAYRKRDAREAAGKAGADFDHSGPVTTLPMMGKIFRVLGDGDTIVVGEDRAEARPVEKILLLHYLSLASGVPPSGRPVAFREVPGCAFYHTTFQAHTVMALVKAFGNEDALFQKACETLAGERGKGSGLVMVLPALPRVPVTLTYWAGEEEMPPGAQVLFDASVVHYFPPEDIAVLGETLVHRVLETAGRGGDVALYEYGD